MVSQGNCYEEGRRLVEPDPPGAGPRYAPTIEAALARARRELKAAGVEQPGLDAEILLAYVLAWERSREDIAYRLQLRDHRLEAVREMRVWLLAHPEEQLSEWAQRYTMFIRERASGRPLAYWLEAVEFMGLQFYVNRYVLIPRPETEVLVEAALHRIENVAAPRILDVGTGSGCIMGSVAVFRPDAEVWAVDVSPQALRVARKNASWLKIRDRFHWNRLDITQLDIQKDPLFADAAGQPAPRFDAVLSNPPYVAPEEAETLPAEVLREPAEALFAADGGFAVMDALFHRARALLKPGGHLLVELGYGQADDAVRRASHAGLGQVEVIPDLAGIPRVLVARA